MNKPVEQETERRVIGLDISTKTGISRLTQEGDRIFFGGSSVITSKYKGWERCSRMAGELMDIVHAFKPTLVVIEGYGYANAHTLVTLVEVGTVLRYFLWQEDIKYVDVPPNSLKKFVTGKGNAGKDMVIKEVYKRWGLEPATNDEADAIGLAYFGMVMLGFPLDMPKVNLSAVSSYMSLKK